MADHLGKQTAVRRRLTRRKGVLFAGLLALIGVSGLLSFAAVNGLMKFPFVATIPPQDLTATAAARAYTTSTTKTGVMDGFDPAHTNWNPYEKVLNATNVPHLVPQMAYPTDDALHGSRAAENGEAAISDRPVVANGMIYVGSGDHKFYAFDASCHSAACQPLWSYATGDAIDSSPAVVNGVVYVGSVDHKLYTFDATCRKACQPLWSYTTGGPVTSSPTVANGIVYIGSDDHKFYAFDTSCRRDCLPLWSYTTEEYIESSPAVANGIVYVASLGIETPDAHVPIVGRLYAFDANCRSACQPLWSYPTGQWITDPSPTVANGFVYISFDDGNLYVFDASCRKDCRPLWFYATHRSSDSAINASPAIANGIIYVGSFDKKLYAFDANCHSATCQPLWSYAMDAPIHESPTVANGVVYVASEGSHIYAFDASCRRDCLPLWTHRGTEMCRVFSEDTRPCHHTDTYNSYVSPTVANGVLYVGSQDGKLYGFGVTVK